MLAFIYNKPALFCDRAGLLYMMVKVYFISQVSLVSSSSVNE